MNLELATADTLSTAATISLIFTGLSFLTALLTGAWKYQQISKSSTAEAHPYVDIAHRSALLYSFAGLMLAQFVEISDLAAGLETACIVVLVFYFSVSIASYIAHGAKGDTDNQFRAPHGGPALHGFMISLIAAEIGAFAILFFGVVRALL